MEMTGAQIVIECLLEHGVDTVFGYPGGAILNIYDELYKNSGKIRHILTAHEQGASHAADGYARVTGKVGVCMATSGPGATNLVTGIATAYLDSVPLVAITCNVGTGLLGKDSFQEIDITGVTMPITKHNFIVMKVDELAETIREAFLIARSGRPGPVLIDIPKDVTAAVTEFVPADGNPAVSAQAAGAMNLRRVLNVAVPSDDEIKNISEIINLSERPFIYAGGGVIISEASAELALLAEKSDIPVGVSLMGKTAFPSRHRLCTGMIGMHGTKASNMAANSCDLMIAVGARFSDRVISDASKFAANTKVIQIDIDPAEIGKNIPVSASLVGDIKAVLARLIPLVDERKLSGWNSRVAEWKKEVPSSYSSGEPLPPNGIFAYIHEKLGDDTVITTEVGQHQMWAAQFYPFSKPRTFLTSGGLGTMGYGTGAAIGAQTAFPDRRVVHIAGDGSFRMNCNELATIGHYGLPVIIIIMDNGTLGMVRQWQTLFYDRHYSSTTLDFGPDFVKLADAYGIQGWHVSDMDGFRAAFDSAVASGKPAVIDAHIQLDEMVLPMVPAGKPIDELMLDIDIKS